MVTPEARGAAGRATAGAAGAAGAPGAAGGRGGRTGPAGAHGAPSGLTPTGSPTPGNGESGTPKGTTGGGGNGGRICAWALGAATGAARVATAAIITARTRVTSRAWRTIFGILFLLLQLATGRPERRYQGRAAARCVPPGQASTRPGVVSPPRAAPERICHGKQASANILAARR